MAEGSQGPGPEGEGISPQDTGSKITSEKTPGILNEPMSGAYSVRDMIGMMGEKAPKQDAMDPQEFARRAKEAAKTREKLTGKPGVLNEPFSGAFKTRDLKRQPSQGSSTPPPAPKGPGK